MKENAEWIRWGIIGLISIGVAYGNIQTIPNLSEKVNGQASRIAVLEARFTTIQEDLGDIKGDIKQLLKRSR